jgi:hypothetical protein
MPATPPKAKKPQDKKPKSSFGKRQAYPIRLPSGSQIEVLRPGVQGLTKAGVIESFDSLTMIVQGETLPKAQGMPVVDVQKATREAGADPKKVQEMLDIMDRICMYVVVTPKLHPTPVLTEEQKADGKTIDDITDPELAYIDYVDAEDKAFIMNVAMGGTTDLAAFRTQSKEAVGDFSGLEATALETVGTSEAGQ